MSRIYGENLLVLWNQAEAMSSLELDPSRWKWVPEGSQREIKSFRERIRKFHARSVPLTVYRPRS